MAKNDNLSEFFTEIIEAIHSKGVTQKIYPYQIPDAIRKCKDSSYVIVEDSSKMFPPIEDLLKDIAAALRDVLGTSELINAQNFTSKVAEISQGESDEHEHEYDWVEVTSPTCVSEGLEEGTCNHCHEKISRPIPADPSAHDYFFESQPPTCTEDGYKHFICSLCGDEKIETTELATGHSWGEWCIEFEPTEEEYGSLYRYCNNNEEHVDSINIPPLNYTDYTVDEHDADCETEGKKIYYYTIDDQEFSFTITIPTYDHEYIDGHCIICGAEDPEYTPPTYTLTFTNACEGMYLYANGVTYTDSADIEVSEGDYVNVGVIDASSAESASLFYACDISTSGDIEDDGGEYSTYEIGDYEGGTVTTEIQTSTSFVIYGDCSITLNPIEKRTLTINYPDYSNHSSTREQVRISSHITASSSIVDTLFDSRTITTSGTKTLVPTYDFVQIDSGNYGYPVDQYISSISGLELVKIAAHTYSGSEGNLGDIMRHTYRIIAPDVVITLK